MKTLNEMIKAAGIDSLVAGCTPEQIEERLEFAAHNLEGFSEACFNDNEVSDLKDFETATPDSTDLKVWGISEDEWREAQADALLAKAYWDDEFMSVLDRYDNIPSMLLDAMESESVNGVSIGDCIVTEIDDDPALVLPGWYADDGNAEVYFPDAKSGKEAAEQYVEDGDYGDSGGIVEVSYWKRAICMYKDEDGEEDIDDDVKIDYETIDVEIQTPEPPCCQEEGHNWESPHELLGGLEENPGVWGHGAGVIENTVCSNCGMQRCIDTAATDPSTGREFTEYSYKEPNEKTLAWAMRKNMERDIESILEDVDAVIQYEYTQQYGDPVLKIEIDEDADAEEVADAIERAITSDREYSFEIEDGAVMITLDMEPESPTSRNAFSLGM